MGFGRFRSKLFNRLVNCLKNLGKKNFDFTLMSWKSLLQHHRRPSYHPINYHRLDLHRFLPILYTRCVRLKCFVA